MTLVANDTGGAISQALVGRRPERIGRLVLTSCDAFENYPPKAVAYLKPTAHVPPALWLLTQAMRLKPVQRLPIAYGWATHAPIEPRIMDSYLGSLRTTAGCGATSPAAARRRPRDTRARPPRALPSSTGRRWWSGRPTTGSSRASTAAAWRSCCPRAASSWSRDSRTFIPEDNPRRWSSLLISGG